MKRFVATSTASVGKTVYMRPYSVHTIANRAKSASALRQAPKITPIQFSYSTTSFRSQEAPKDSNQSKGGDSANTKGDEDKEAVVGKAIRTFVAAAVLGFAITNEPWKWLETQKDSSDAKPKEAEPDLAEIQSIITDRVYLDIQFPNQSQPERLIIALYGKDCPKTVENFKALCNGYSSPSPSASSASQPWTYKGCKIHRIIPGFMLQSGDFTKGNGTGGRSIFETPMFADESFKLQHKGLGIVSMANRGPNTNSSQFFICFEATPWLDHHHVVFGQVVSGIATLQKIEGYGSRSGSVAEDLRIVDCGSLPPLEETLAMNNSSEELDEMGHSHTRIMK